MSREPTQQPDPTIRALNREILGADDPQIMRIVTLVDTMMQRGTADLLIEPLRRRLAVMRPPHPLRFSRLMFHPLDLLIVPTSRWRPASRAIPRTALVPMAEHVRLAMGPAAAAMDAEIAGHTTADTDLISRLGRSLWPKAAVILAAAPMPRTWDEAELGDRSYRPLADAVSALLAEAATLDTLCSEAATGLLPPTPDTIAAMLGRVVRLNKDVLPMMIAVLLDRLPQAAALLPAVNTGPEAHAVHAAMDEATDLLLRQLDREEGADARIAVGTLAEAGAAAGRVASLLKHLDTANVQPQRRQQMRAVRQRLEADCKARFASGLQDELLIPLQHMGSLSADTDIPALEAAARGLRVLETEGRSVGGGSTYDLLLGKAAEAIKADTMSDRLSRADQMRLVEILSGPDAALAMLERPR
jgi:hypothetical protein